MSLKPTAQLLRGLVTVTEERHRWVKGFLVSEPDTDVEISFELIQGAKPLPGTYITYFGVLPRNGRKQWFEFELGTICIMPTQEQWELIRPVIERLQGYRPLNVV